MPLATPEELAKWPPPPLPDWIVKLNSVIPGGLVPRPESQIQFVRADTKSGHKGEEYWTSAYGPQTWGLRSPYDETVVGGSRGGGKSSLLIAWMAMGDPFLMPDDPAYYSYLLEPSYRGLILRKEYQSMAEFVDEAMEFYGPLGAKKKDDPIVFEFPKTGAKIYTNHLGDQNAFEKYRGWGITRIGIEELTQIEEERWYLKLLGSLRAKRQVRRYGRKVFPALRSQIMSTTNPDGPGRCVPYGDVLTESGWKPIENMKIGDRIWSVDPVSGQMILKMVDQVHAEQYDGELYQADGRGLHVVCTPNHKILRFNTTKGAQKKLILDEIRKFPGQATIMRAPLRWKGYGPKTVEARSMRRRMDAKWPQPTELPIELYAALVGWMVTEGSLVKRDNAICITQLKPVGIQQIKTLLDACGFKQNWGAKSVLIYSHEWLDHFSWLPHSYDKFVPGWIKNLPVKCLEVLMEAMVNGDGTRESKDSGYFFSSSAQLAADFCEIALKCGYMVYATGRQREPGGTIRGIPINGHKAYAHEISYHKQSLNGSELRTGNHTYKVATSTKRLNVKRVPYSGPVYCIGVHGTHTFIIRQNGCVWISGNSWVKKRFVKILNAKGLPIKPNTPMKDSFSGLMRIFIPMSRHDNPFLRENKQYESMLLSQDEVTRKQWMGGDWDADVGSFFSEFRPAGPITDEEKTKYPWARHVIEPNAYPELRDYWYRWGGGDWGYDHPAVFHKNCLSQRTGQIHCYDELSLRGVGSFELGVRLAQWWMPDLEGLPDKTATIALSPDAFSKTDSGLTKAEQMARGMNEILGPYGAFLMKYTDDERDMMEKDPQLAAQMFNRRMGEHPTGAMRLVLHSASKDRSGGFSFMRDLLRFRPIVTETEEELKERLRTTFERGAVEAYERELAKIKKPVDEVLPRLQIWRRCTGLIRCMEEARYPERKNEHEKQPEEPIKVNAIDGVGGDDPLESERYALRAFKEVEKVMPKSYFVSERMEHIQMQYETLIGEGLTDPNRLLQVRLRQEATYDRVHLPVTAFTPPRASSSRHRAGRHQVH